MKPLLPISALFLGLALACSTDEGNRRSKSAPDAASVEILEGKEQAKAVFGPGPFCTPDVTKCAVGVNGCNAGTYAVVSCGSFVAGGPIVGQSCACQAGCTANAAENCAGGMGSSCTRALNIAPYGTAGICQGTAGNPCTCGLPLVAIEQKPAAAAQPVSAPAAKATRDPITAP